MNRILFLFVLFFLWFGKIFGQSQILLDSLAIKYENASTDSVKISALRELYRQYFRIDNYTALEYADKILKLAEETHNDKYKDIGLYYKMLSYMYIGNYAQCLEINMERLTLNKRSDNITGVFGAYHDMGVTYDRLRQFDLALEYYFNALNTYNENYEGHSKEFSTYNIQSLYNNIGNIYSSNEDFEEAEQYYQKGIAICKQKKDFMNLGAAYNNLGKIYMVKDDEEKALWYLTRALQIRDSIHDENGLGTSHIFFSYYSFSKGDYDKAISHALKGYEIGKKIPSLSIESQSASSLADTYSALQRYDSAFYYYKIYKDLSDSLVNKETFGKIESLRLQNELEVLTQKQKLESQKIKFRYITILLLSALVVGVLFGFFWHYKERKERITSEYKDLKMEVEIRNKELTSNAMQQVRRNSLLVSVEERLQVLKKKLNPEQKNLIQKIIVDLHALSSENEVWEEFELRFQKVHEDFYNNLKVRFPHLSPSEIKLAALLRLNMTSKDISSLTGLSIKSIESSRYRLRKKLGIANKEVNLVGFLMEI